MERPRLNEKKLDIKDLNKQSEMDEAMMLYDQLAEVFIKNNTSLPTSYKVLCAMADAVFVKMLENTNPDVFSTKM